MYSVCLRERLTALGMENPVFTFATPTIISGMYRYVSRDNEEKNTNKCT